MSKSVRLGLALTAVMCAISASPVFAGTLEKIKERQKLIVAVQQDCPPFGSIGPDMQPHGIDIDISNYMAKKLGVALELVPTIGSNRIPFMQTGKADIIVACLGKTAEREKIVGYSKPYMADFIGVFGDADNKAAKPEELSGHVVAVSRGGTEDVALTKIVPNGGQIQRYQDQASALAAYTSGQADMIAIQGSVAATFNKTSPRKALPKIRMESEPSYIGVPKGDDEMIKVANDTISEMYATGTLGKIAQDWLGDATAADIAK